MALRRSTTTFLFAAAFAAACATTPGSRPAPDAAAIPALAPRDFPALARMECGFDARDADGSWKGNDRVDFALRLTKGDTEKRWIVRLSPLLDQSLAERMMARGESGMWQERSWNFTVGSGSERRAMSLKSLQLPVTAQVLDDGGRSLSSTLIYLPADLLGAGLLEAIDRARALPVADAASGASGSSSPAFDENTVRPLVGASIAMMSLLNALQENDSLAAYFWQVVEKPGFFSVLTSFGVSATMDAAFDKAVPAALPPHLPTAERAFVVPMQIDVNGSPALLVDVVAIDAARPFALCGGMIAAVARHPSKDIRLEVQLMSARCEKQQ